MTAAGSNRQHSKVFFFVAALATLSLLSAAQTSAPPPAQDGEQSPDTTTFRVNTHLALTDVVVIDRPGMPIHGLTAKDFHVFEDGVEQNISSFEEHTGRAGEAPEAEDASLPPDTYSNATLNRRDLPLFVILLDSLNTAMSDQSFAQSELLALAKSLPKGSRVSVFRLGSGLKLLQGFTEDADELVATLKSKKASPQLGAFFNDPNLNLALNAPDPTAGMGMKGGPGVTNVQHTFALQDVNEAGIQSDLVVEATIRALKALGLYLSQFPGRKNLVWLSGTFPIDIVPSIGNTGLETSMIAGGADPFRGNRTYTIALTDLALLLQSANIAVYPVDARGMVDNGLFNPAGGGYGRASADVANAGLALAAFASSNAQIREIMQTIAHETGGRAYYNTNDLKGSMMEAFNDGSNYYSLSYVPANQKWDGQFRKIRVRVDRPETKLYYRQGYYAEELGKLKHSFPSPDPSMKSAMLCGSPAVSEITFQVKLTPQGGVQTIAATKPALRSRDDKPISHLTGPVIHYTIEYTIKPSELQFYSSPSKVYRGRLAFSAIVFDKEGKALNAGIGAFATPLSAEVYDAMQHDAMHVKMGIDLPLGAVYLRVGVHDLTTDKLGAFEIPLNVTADMRASK